MLSGNYVCFCFVVNGITEEANPTIYSGKVIRPLRGVDPTQIEYQGLTETVKEGDMKGEVYPFGTVGMANKGDCLQKGESVKFQLCVLGQNAQTMAYNITPLRRATVECVKDQVIKCYVSGCAVCPELGQGKSSANIYLLACLLTCLFLRHGFSMLFWLIWNSPS